MVRARDDEGTVSFEVRDEPFSIPVSIGEGVGEISEGRSIGIADVRSWSEGISQAKKVFLENYTDGGYAKGIYPGKVAAFPFEDGGFCCIYCSLDGEIREKNVVLEEFRKGRSVGVSSPKGQPVDISLVSEFFPFSWMWMNLEVPPQLYPAFCPWLTPEQALEKLSPQTPCIFCFHEGSWKYVTRSSEGIEVIKEFEVRVLKDPTSAEDVRFVVDGQSFDDLSAMQRVLSEQLDHAWHEWSAVDPELSVDVARGRISASGEPSFIICQRRKIDRGSAYTLLYRGKSGDIKTLTLERGAGVWGRI